MFKHVMHVCTFMLFEKAEEKVNNVVAIYEAVVEEDFFSGYGIHCQGGWGTR